MWLAVITMMIGLAVLAWSADLFIDGATLLAKILQVPSFLVGVLILGFGTSAPEMVVSVLAAMQGSPELALGNAYGSNIMNIALVLGTTALISPMIIRRSIVIRDLPLLIIITALAAWQLRDGQLSQMDGALLLISLVAVLGLQIMLGRREQYLQPDGINNIDGINNADSTDNIDGTDSSDSNDDAGNNASSNATEPPSLARGMSRLLIGMLLLVISSRAIVWGAVELATFWGLSELIIGLTIVAVGTSLPELMSSLSAAYKGEHDMALGNIIGSNMFNTLGVVGLAAFVTPIAANPVILSRDITMVGILTVLLFALCGFAFINKRRFGRGSGATLLLCFVGYTLWLLKTVNM